LKLSLKNNIKFFDRYSDVNDPMLAENWTYICSQVSV